MQEHYVTAIGQDKTHNYLIFGCRCGEILAAAPTSASGVMKKHIQAAKAAEPEPQVLPSLEDVAKQLGIEYPLPPLFGKKP